MNKVLLEGVLVAVIGAGLALVANGLSPRGLKLTRNYFPGSSASSDLAGAAPKSNGGSVQSNSPSPSESLAARLQAEGLQLADSNQVIQLFHDPRFEEGLVLFLDARDDSHYQAGHIPGAYQLDYFHPEKYLGALLPLLQAAQQIVVYCNGGDCEDSQHTAIMLRDDAAVPAQKLLVYGGGITEWSANRLPIESGLRHSGKLLSSK